MQEEEQRQQLRQGRSPVDESEDTIEERALFGILRRRHACRNFEHREIPDDVLWKLVYAAHRAPTGGNAPYRFVVVVRDRIQLKMIKLVSPGFFGDASAAIFICTDARSAYEGRGGSAELLCATYDAGAAAENVVLAAYSMGLGASFIKSYSEAAVDRILNLPEGCRTELLVSVGYPSRDEPRPLKKRRGGTMTFRDRYGEAWAEDRINEVGAREKHPTVNGGNRAP
jgi:nitroreductase